MKIKSRNLEWYAFYYNWNNHKLEWTNVLGGDIKEIIATKIKQNTEFGKIKDYNSLKYELECYFKRRYWCKCEYEVLVRDFGNYTPNCDETKIDIWWQLEPNIDRICEYIIRELELNYKK